jgi:hypothetical protein
MEGREEGKRMEKRKGEGKKKAKERVLSMDWVEKGGDGGEKVLRR